MDAVGNDLIINQTSMRALLASSARGRRSVGRKLRRRETVVPHGTAPYLRRSLPRAPPSADPLCTRFSPIDSPPASLSALHILSCDTAIFSLSKHSVFSSHGILEDFFRIIYEGFIDIKKRILLFTIKILTNVKVYFERVSKCLKKKGNE